MIAIFEDFFFRFSLVFRPWNTDLQTQIFNSTTSMLKYVLHLAFLQFANLGSLLFAIFCLLFAVFYLLFASCCLIFAVCYCYCYLLFVWLT